MFANLKMLQVSGDRTKAPSDFFLCLHPCVGLFLSAYSCLANRGMPDLACGAASGRGLPAPHSCPWLPILVIGSTLTGDCLLRMVETRGPKCSAHSQNREENAIRRVQVMKTDDGGPKPRPVRSQSPRQIRTFGSLRRCLSYPCATYLSWRLRACMNS